MVLVEVVYEVPEALFVLFFRAELGQVDFELPLEIQLVADVLIQLRRRQEVRLELFVPACCSVGFAMDLLADCHFQPWHFNVFAAESAQNDSLSFRIVACLGNGFPELRCQKLALALLAFFFELEANLVAVDLRGVGRSRRRLKCALAEAQRVANLSAKLRRRVEKLLLLALEEILAVLRVVVIVIITVSPGAVLPYGRLLIHN